MDKKETEYVIYGGAGLLLLLVFFALSKNTGSSTAGTVPSISSADANYAETMYNSSNNFALQRSQEALQTLTAYEQNSANLQLGLAQINAATQQARINASSAEDIASITSNAQVQTQQLESAAAVSAAQYQAQSVEKIASSQQAASQAQSHAQQQTGLYSSISNFLGTIAKVFGL